MTKELLFHIPGTYQPGTTVKVVRAVPNALAWHEEWTDASQELVGKTGKVIEADDLRGVRVEKRGVVRAWVPSCSLELPSNLGPTVIQVPAWEAN